jgi:TolA-binding protein
MCLRVSRVSLMASVVMVAFTSLPRAFAADSVPAEYEERVKRLNGLVEDLMESQSAMQKRVAGLTDELHAVRESSAKVGDKLGDRFATREEVRKLAESVRELDRKREEDKQLILSEIKKLAQTPVVVPPRDTPKSAPPPKEKEPADDGPAKGYKYIIKKNDTLSAIVKAYRQSGVKVSTDDILRANPDLKPTNMREGREIFIPDPALK